MSKLDRITAAEKLAALQIPVGANFFSLDHDAISRLLDEAKRDGYRQPQNANGGKARYYHERLQRAAVRKG